MKKVKKRIAIGLIITISSVFILPYRTADASTNEEDILIDGVIIYDEENNYNEYDNCNDYDKELIIEENGLEVDGVYYSQDEFEKLLDESYDIETETNPNSRSAGVIAGTWYIPFVGKVVVTVAGTIIIGGAIIKAGSWIYNKVRTWFSQKSDVNTVKNKIPSSLKKGNGDVNLGSFKDKNGKTPLNKNSGTFKNGRWSVEKDNAGHGGRKWKIKKDSNRVGSLDKNGKILGK